MNRLEFQDWYNRFYRESGLTEAGPWYLGVAELLGRGGPKDLPASTVLEVGCGSGSFLASLNVKARVGIDLSEEACRHTQRRGASAAVGAGEHIPFMSGCFDVVICCEALEHVASPREVVREIRRVLKPSGVFAVSFPNYFNVPWLALRVISDVLRKPDWIVRQPVDRFLTYSNVTRLLRASGFEKIGQVGWIFEPPGVYHWRQRHGRRPVRGEHLAALAFHPVLLMRKSET